MQTTTHQADTSKIQNSTDTETKWNSNSTNFQKLENTVFGLVHIPEEGYFLAIGANRITEYFPTAQEAIDQLETDMWNIIFKLIIIVTGAAHEVDKQKNMS